ncbi:hypothetical protein LMH66_00480 [Shewanella sp. 10N.7]|uniref:hypothetical protein n=1 Tax=Shewanella sp. 10N.7 TaxID=2885093 RepID=UPI001E60204E|nr:hypothetical protein [Shewanella sp. 10N.7]MCC4831106.1 hypothetical protein [Shewanella sp. 10N.7]
MTSFIFSYCSFCLFVYMFLEASTLRGMLLSLSSLFIVLILLFGQFSKRADFFTYLVIMFSFIYLAPLLFNGSFHLIGAASLSYVSTLASVLIASFFIAKRTCFYWLSYAILTLFTVIIFLSYINSFITGIPFAFYADSILLGQSRNVVSFYFIALSVGFVLSCNLNNKKPNMYLLSLVFFLNLLLISRTGIALSIVILSLVLMYYNKLLLVLLVGGVIVSTPYIIFFLINETNFSQGLDTPRTIMTSEYLSQITISNLLFGFDVSSMPTINNFNGNAHNAYLSLSIHYGYPMLFFIFLSISLLIVTVCVKRNFFVFILLSVLIVRYCSDTVAFNGFFTDYIFYTIAAYCLFSVRLFKARNITSDQIQ